MDTLFHDRVSEIEKYWESRNGFGYSPDLFAFNWEPCGENTVKARLFLSLKGGEYWIHEVKFTFLPGTYSISEASLQKADHDPIDLLTLDHLSKCG